MDSGEWFVLAGIWFANNIKPRFGAMELPFSSTILVVGLSWRETYNLPGYSSKSKICPSLCFFILIIGIWVKRTNNLSDNFGKVHNSQIQENFGCWPYGCLISTALKASWLTNFKAAGKSKTWANSMLFCQVLLHKQQLRNTGTDLWVLMEAFGRTLFKDRYDECNYFRRTVRCTPHFNNYVLRCIVWYLKNE